VAITLSYERRTGGTIMGFLDEINNAMKKVEEEVKKAELDRHFKDLEQGINKAGSSTSGTGNNPPAPSPHQSAPSADPAGRRYHKGYSRITAWMKTRYQGKLSGIQDPLQKKLELEQLSAEACSGLSSKAKQGFLDYLKSQNYEQLLK
jgi:hypothetical protein